MRGGGGIKVGRHFKLMMMSEMERKRKIERRKAALFKQAKELCVLCDVEIGVAMFGPNEGGPIVWPTMEEATKLFLGFWGLPEVERGKKMVTHEKFLGDWVNGEIEKMWKKEEEVERKEMNDLMKQVILGTSVRLEEMDQKQLLGLSVLAGEKMQELEKRKQDLLQQQQQQKNDGGGAAGVRRPDPDTDDGSYYVPQPPVPLFDAWWKTASSVGLPPPATETPAMPALDGGGEGSHHQMIFSADAAGGSSSTNNGGGNYAAASSSSNYGDHQLPDLTQAWPFTFSFE